MRFIGKIIAAVLFLAMLVFAAKHKVKKQGTLTSTFFSCENDTSQAKTCLYPKMHRHKAKCADHVRIHTYFPADGSYCSITFCSCSGFTSAAWWNGRRDSWSHICSCPYRSGCIFWRLIMVRAVAFDRQLGF